MFSTIEDNHIYNIAIKREFYGYEIGGIKLHAAIDVIIRHNRIHDCSLGIWLDWQTQGTRVSRNLFYGNSRDLFVEVSHGPYLVDHNILASRVSLESFSQGGAYVNNLVCGTVGLEPSWTDRRRTTSRTAPRWPATPPSTAATTATSATSSSAATRPWPTDRSHHGRGANSRLRHRRLRRTPGIAGGLPRAGG